MLQAFVITLREGLEAFLIVAISLAYLRKSGRAELTRAVHLGIVGDPDADLDRLAALPPTSSIVCGRQGPFNRALQ